MNEDLIRNKQNAIYRNRGNTIELYEALFKGALCYCMEHIPTGDKAVFSHEMDVLARVMDRIHASGVKFSKGFRFTKKGKVRGVSLPIFLFAAYSGVDTDELVHAKLIISEKDGITDLRRGKIERKGGIDTNGIDIIEEEDRRYILIDKYDIITTLVYKEPLYQILIDRRFCGITVSNKRHRIMIYDGSGKSRNMSLHIGRLVLLYNTYYERYGSVMEFWTDILRLSDEVECEASHILADTWNCCDNNLMWMDEETNKAMYQYSNYFAGNYGLYAVACDSVILAEIQFAPGHGSRFVCESPEEYMNMQRELLGKDIKIGEGKQVKSLLENKVIFTADGGVMEMPEQARKKINHVPENITREYVIRKVRSYSQNAQRLIDSYRNGGDFVPWKSDRSITSVGNVIAGLVPGLMSLLAMRR